MEEIHDDEVVVADGGFFDMLRDIEKKVLMEMDTPDSRESLRIIEQEEHEAELAALADESEWEG